MSKLKTYKFSDLYSMSSGISTTPEQAGHGAPFVSFKTVFNNYFLPDVLTEYMDTSKKEKKTYSVKKGDIFLTRTSETLDELGMSCVAIKDYPQASYSGFLKRLRPTQNNITYDKYMAFYLRSELFRKTMNNNAVMTLRASLNEQIFSYLDLILPEYSEQKKIGDLLYLINTKINLNNRINAELEAMAKLLYDYWFVQFDFPISAAYAASVGRPDLTGKPYKSSGGKMVYNKRLKREIPEGWVVKPLADITLTLMRGISPVYLEEGGACVLNQKCIRNKSINFDLSRRHNHELKSAASKFIEYGDVLVNSTGVGTLGRVAFVKRLIEPITTVDSHVTIVRADKSKINKYFLGYSLTEKQSEIELLGEGSTGQTELSRENLGKLQIVIPSEYLQLKFEKIVNPLFKKMANNEDQNQDLAKLRDWLLPMLMNGQVKVK